MGNSKTISFFGLSGAGKTTLANALKNTLVSKGLTCFILDGDVIRKGINRNLGFSRTDRRENARRIAELCKVLIKINVIPIVAAITPYDSDRILISDILDRQLTLIHVSCSLEQCERRDPKGLYKLAREGKIKKFTGITDIFEYPNNNESIIISTEKRSLDDCIHELLKII